MSRFTKQQLLDALYALPPAIRDIVLSAEQADAFTEIMRKHALTVAQIDIVATEVAPVLYGLTLPDSLPLQLKRGIPELPQETIDALVSDINTLLLKDIRDQVVALAQKNARHGSTAAIPSLATHVPAVSVRPAPLPPPAPKQPLSSAFSAASPAAMQPARPVAAPLPPPASVPTQPVAPSIPAPVPPPPTNLPSTPSAGIAETKLSGSVHLPSDAVTVKEEPAIPSAASAPTVRPVVSGRTYADGADPYREPTN